MAGRLRAGGPAGGRVGGRGSKIGFTFSLHLCYQFTASVRSFFFVSCLLGTKGRKGTLWIITFVVAGGNGAAFRGRAGGRGADSVEADVDADAGAGATPPQQERELRPPAMRVMC